MPSWPKKHDFVQQRLRNPFVNGKAIIPKSNGTLYETKTGRRTANSQEKQIAQGRGRVAFRICRDHSLSDSVGNSFHTGNGGRRKHKHLWWGIPVGHTFSLF